MQKKNIIYVPNKYNINYNKKMHRIRARHCTSSTTKKYFRHKLQWV